MGDQVTRQVVTPMDASTAQGTRAAQEAPSRALKTTLVGTCVACLVVATITLVVSGIPGGIADSAFQSLAAAAPAAAPPTAAVVKKGAPASVVAIAPPEAHVYKDTGIKATYAPIKGVKVKVLKAPTSPMVITPPAAPYSAVQSQMIVEPQARVTYAGWPAPAVQVIYPNSNPGVKIIKPADVVPGYAGGLPQPMMPGYGMGMMPQAMGAYPVGAAGAVGGVAVGGVGPGDTVVQ